MPPEPAPTWQSFVDGLDIFLDPILCGAAAGLVLGFLGVYVVLRRMVFVSAAVTHSAGLGVAIAFYAHIHLGAGPALSPVYGAFVLGLGATLLLALNPERLRLTHESLVGLCFIFASSASLLVGDRISQESRDIHAIIFGTAVLVSKADLWATLGVGGLVLLAHLWLRRGFVFASFDPETARVQRLPVRLLDGLLLLSVGLMVSVTTRALGAMPVFAFSVLPAMAALALRLRLGWAFAVAAVLGAAAAVFGYLASFFLHFPVGASQTVVAAIFAGLAMAVGALARPRRMA
jgi:zinc transport system permease protein